MLLDVSQSAHRIGLINRKEESLFLVYSSVISYTFFLSLPITVVTFISHVLIFFISLNGSDCRFRIVLSSDTSGFSLEVILVGIILLCSQHKSFILDTYCH